MNRKGAKNNHRTQGEVIAVMSEKIDRIERDISEIKKSINDKFGDLKDTMEGRYTTKQEFDPVKEDVQSLKNIVQWVARIIIGTIVIALLALLGFRS